MLPQGGATVKDIHTQQADLERFPPKDQQQSQIMYKLCTTYIYI